MGFFNGIWEAIGAIFIVIFMIPYVVIRQGGELFAFFLFLAMFAGMIALGIKILHICVDDHYRIQEEVRMQELRKKQDEQSKKEQG